MFYRIFLQKTKGLFWAFFDRQPERRHKMMRKKIWHNMSAGKIFEMFSFLKYWYTSMTYATEWSYILHSLFFIHIKYSLVLYKKWKQITWEPQPATAWCEGTRGATDGPSVHQRSDQLFLCVMMKTAAGSPGLLHYNYKSNKQWELLTARQPSSCGLEDNPLSELTYSLLKKVHKLLYITALHINTKHVNCLKASQ